MAVSSDELFQTLTDSDPYIRSGSWDALEGYFGERERLSVASAIIRVCDEDALSYAWPDCREILDRSPDPAQVFDYLLDGLAERPEGGLAPLLGARTDLADVAPDANAYTRTLLNLLASPLPWVRTSAVRALAASAVTAPALRALRHRPGTPARARTTALRTLAEIGWAELTDRDQAVLRRLVAVKQHTEQPEPAWLEANWYAIPTTDRDAVLDAFDLRDPVPVTLRGGFAPWLVTDGSRPMNFSQYELADRDPYMLYRQVFLTPALDGWTLVVSDHDLLSAGRDACYARCAELSHRFGTTHWYTQSYASGCDDHSGWCIAERGKITARCYYDNYDYPGDEPLTGPSDAHDACPTLDELRQAIDARDHGRARPPTSPAAPRYTEAELLAKIFGTDAPDTTAPDSQDDPVTGLYDDWELSAGHVAGRICVDPQTLDQDITVEGAGVLAMPSSLHHLRRYGALPL